VAILCFYYLQVSWFKLVLWIWKFISSFK